jgi:hypothetical protein
VANRITTLFDLDAKGFDSGLKNLRTKISETDGAFGKMKVGASGVMDTIKANAGAAALGVAGLAVAVGAKAVMAFEDGALAAGKFSDASGLATTDASRWREVADDMGVGADTMAANFVKLEKAIGSGKPAVKALGIEVKKTADGQVDMNATMLDTIQRLGQIQDPTKKATLAAELFGKGWADSAEIITGSAADIKARLDSVADAQVFDEGEVEKAREFRDALENLKDKSQALANELGAALVPALTDLADVISGVASASEKLKAPTWLKWGQKLSPLHGLSVAFGHINDDLQEMGVISKDGPDLGSTFDGVASSADDVKGAFAHAKHEAIEMAAAVEGGNSTFSVYVDNVQHAAEATDRKAEADKKAAEDADKHRAAVDALADAMEAQRSAALELIGGDIGVREAQRQAKKAAEDLNDVLDDQNTTLADAGAAIDDAAQSQLDAASAAADYKVQQIEANGETVDANTKALLYKEELQKLVGQLDGPLAAAIQNYIDQLGAIPTTVGTTIVLNKPGRVGDINPFGRTNAPRASGGPTYPGLHRVIERGPELLQDGGNTYLMSAGGGRVIPMSAASGSAPSGGNSYEINLYGGNATPAGVVDAIKKWERSNGAGWRA